MEDKLLNPDLLRKIMMGGFSGSDKEEKSSGYKQKRKLEVDLHFEKLFPDKQHVSSSEKLVLQLAELDHFIVEAKKSTSKVGYVIVGKGTGKLKTEVEKRLTNLGLIHCTVANPPYFGNAIKVTFR